MNLKNRVAVLTGAGSAIDVTVVHPNGVATSIAGSARTPVGVPPAEQAGEIIVKAIKRERERVLIGNDSQIAALQKRMMPVRYWGLLRSAMPS